MESSINHINKLRKKMKRTLLLLAFAVAFLADGYAQTASSMKWSEICSGKMSADWYGSEEAQQIADRLLNNQKNSGGWMKNIELHKEDDSSGKSELSCLDNAATTMEMRFLAKVYQKTKAVKYQESFQKALNMIFTAEKSVGGWSQYWPLSGNGSYQDYITFNDDLMTNVMKILKDIYTNKGDFADIVDETNRTKCQASFDKAIECIINCQVDDNGTKAAWCAQHDPNDFLPMEGRPHELPSISGYESANLLSYLMTIENPSEALQNTIHTAVAWLDAHKYKDNAAVENFTNANGESDRHIVEKSGSAVWGRFIQLGGETGNANYQKFFNKLNNRNKSRSYSTGGKTYTYKEYEIATNSYNAEKAYQPIFAIYDDQLQHLYYRFLYSFEDAPETTDWKGCTVPTSLNALRRTKYQFMGSWPLNVIKNEYPAWKQRMESQGGDDYTTYILSTETNTGDNSSSEYHFDNGITITNANNKGYGAGKSNTIKYSAGVDYTVTLPANMKISKVSFYGYDNYDSNAYINSFNGTQYGTTDYVFPAKNGDDMTYVTHTLTAASPISGSFTFSLGKKQCCLILTLYQNNGNTAITLPVSNEQQTPIYNLQGVRVTNPGQGIYIQNGKKYIK